VLDFVCQRRSAADLDDQVRTLADNDALTLEASYSLTRFITWAIPILGFLGTVLGITGAIAGVSRSWRESSLADAMPWAARPEGG
jgi:biopolymer transport protein ExbB/TolQ